MRQLAEEERQAQLQKKRELGSYYKQAVDQVDRQRKNQFEQKKHDTTNQSETFQLQEEA